MRNKKMIFFGMTLSFCSLARELTGCGRRCAVGIPAGRAPGVKSRATLCPDCQISAPSAPSQAWRCVGTLHTAGA